MKKRVIFILSMFIALFVFLPSVQAETTWNSNDIICSYVGDNNIKSEMTIVGLSKEHLNPSLTNLYIHKGTGDKPTVIYKSDGDNIIENWDFPFSYIVDEKDDEETIHDELEFVLRTYILEQVEKAEKGNAASLICPSYLTYYKYKYDGWFKKGKEKEIIVAANTNKQVKRFNEYMKTDYDKKMYDLETIKLKYDAGTIFNKEDINDKTEETLAAIEEVNKEILELEKKLEKNPNDKETQKKLKKAKKELEKLYQQLSMYEQGTVITGQSNSKEGKKNLEKIKKVRGQNTEVNVNINITEDCAIISDDLQDWIIQLLDIIKIGALALTLVLGMFDFFKGVASGEADAMKKMWKSFSKRLIAVVILFLLPVIIEFVLGLINIYGVNADDPLCGIK